MRYLFSWLCHTYLYFDISKVFNVVNKWLIGDHYQQLKVKIFVMGPLNVGAVGIHRSHLKNQLPLPYLPHVSFQKPALDVSVPTRLVNSQTNKKLVLSQVWTLNKSSPDAWHLFTWNKYLLKHNLLHHILQMFSRKGSTYSILPTLLCASTCAMVLTPVMRVSGDKIDVFGNPVRATITHSGWQNLATRCRRKVRVF